MHVQRLIALTGMAYVESRWLHGAFVVQRRRVHLPSRHQLSSTLETVTGPIYEMPSSPSVKLFTREGCTLCDKVKDVRTSLKASSQKPRARTCTQHFFINLQVLESVREEHPHSLYAVDITDDDKQEWFSKYKYDIPVLHIDDVYWAKHRLTREEAIAALVQAREGSFRKSKGEPDAGRLEHS
ncbi:hypothetical protein ACHAWO_010916 [Cyclotella atomus]|uniref:Glutaredoxin-like protein n=1 Tax=Cyclotella atomus TaxID=382360 RepID=A0ABD3PTI3_9STRA